ncbi:MAG TPA: gamma-glutamyltransferase [Casimicrobiaceae bacterium]|nr:gamma-glutamyltransferase [Casimicrobiaceae bacterium]
MTPGHPTRAGTLLLALALPLSVFGQPASLEHPSGWTPKQAASARREIIGTANPLATDAGYRILRRGGSAVDAAIAVQMVLNLVEPQSSGIGGGAFMLVHDARRQTLTAYDGRETAPAAARPDRFLDETGRPLPFLDAVVGGRSVGVPGTLRMLELAHRRHGRLPWAILFAPAIRLASEGFVVSPRLSHAIAAERFGQDRARAYFHNADGSPLAAGQRLANPAFAATLERIASAGAAAFYSGEIARDMVRTVADYRASPGDLSAADLAGYRAIARTPVCSRYRRYKVCGMPPPSSGGIGVLQMLGILERFDMQAIGGSALLRTHLFSEAGRLAYADRAAYIADPAFVAPRPGLLDRDYLRLRSESIRLDASIGHAAAGVPPPRRGAAFGIGAAPEFPSTSHVSIVDRYGNAVAMTTTIEHAFGSTLLTAGGFLLNNELTDFSFLPECDGAPVANRVEAGKRPRSTMAPTIAYDARGRVAIVAGSPGGSAIINYVAKTLVGIIDWRLDPQAAIDLPNVGSRNGPVEIERGSLAVALVDKLHALGDATRIVDQDSGLQVVVRTARGWSGAADPRREGSVRGD